MIQPWVFAVLFCIAAILGLRGSIRLTQRYIDVVDKLQEREALILIAIVITSWIITGAAGWFGTVNVVRLLGLDFGGEVVVLSAVIATLVLFIPAFLDAMVDRVARVPWK